jgi:hypothetical protein
MPFSFCVHWRHAHYAVLLKLQDAGWPYRGLFNASQWPFACSVDSASNRNEYQESLKIKKSGGKVRLARRADNLVAIY